MNKEELIKKVERMLLANVQMGLSRNTTAKCAIKLSQDEQLEILVQWAIKQGFSTGHADNIESLLEEIELDIVELRNKGV